MVKIYKKQWYYMLLLLQDWNKLVCPMDPPIPIPNPQPKLRQVTFLDRNDVDISHSLYGGIRDDVQVHRSVLHLWNIRRQL